MCKYCDKWESCSCEPLLELNDNYSVVIENNCNDNANPVITLWDDFKFVELNIKYCPVCGSKLI